MKLLSLILISFSLLAADAEIVELPRAYQLKQEYSISGKTYSSYATAFPISEHTLLTVGHITQGEGVLFVCIEGVWSKCSIQRVDLEFDIALLECNAVFNPFILDAGEFKTGILEGFPSGQKAVLEATRAKDEFTKTFLHCVLTSNRFTGGGSGSPITSNGKLVGMATGHNDQRLWPAPDGMAFVAFLPTRRIKQFLAEK